MSRTVFTPAISLNFMVLREQVLWLLSLVSCILTLVRNGDLELCLDFLSSLLQ